MVYIGYKRHPNCNLPSFKKIESTLQKRRKSIQPKDELTSIEKMLEGSLQVDSVNSSSSVKTHELEVQLEEVYHPEENPHYFLSPNIAYKPFVPKQPQTSCPVSISCIEERAPLGRQNHLLKLRLALISDKGLRVGHNPPCSTEACWCARRENLVS